MKIIHDNVTRTPRTLPPAATSSSKRHAPSKKSSKVRRTSTIPKLSFKREETPTPPLESSQGSQTAAPKLERVYEHLWSSKFLPRLFIQIGSSSRPWAKMTSESSIPILQELKDEIYPSVSQVLDKKSSIARIVSFSFTDALLVANAILIVKRQVQQLVSQDG